MRGITKIELTDVHTGEKEVFEDENIITNAAEIYTSLFSTRYSNGGSDSGLLPLYNSTFGGVKLFSAPIDENPDNYFLPDVGINPIVGYASKDTSAGIDPLRGSRNLAETKELEDGMQIVWDFATSESNGTISCVCLTTSNGGRNSFYFPTDDDVFFDATRTGHDGASVQIIGIDENNDNIITLNAYSDRYRKRVLKYNIGSIMLNDMFNKTSLKDEVIKELNVSGMSFRYDGNGNIYSIISVSPLKLRKINLTTDEISEFIVETSGLAYLNLDSSRFVVRDGFLYLMKGNLEGYYKIDMGNNSDVVDVILPKFGNYNPNNHHIAVLKNDNVLVDGVLSSPNGENYNFVDKDFNVINGSCYNDSVSTTSYFSRYDFINYKGLQIINKYRQTGPPYSQVFLDHNMLMSINNLETPVIKTADKTMKITYTLLYEEEVPV